VKSEFKNQGLMFNFEKKARGPIEIGFDTFDFGRHSLMTGWQVGIIDGVWWWWSMGKMHTISLKIRLWFLRSICIIMGKLWVDSIARFAAEIMTSNAQVLCDVATFSNKLADWATQGLPAMVHTGRGEFNFITVKSWAIRAALINFCCCLQIYQQNFLRMLMLIAIVSLFVNIECK